jgi:ATP-dependent DNA ligase
LRYSISFADTGPRRQSFAPSTCSSSTGEDLRREPIETRKSTLKSLLRGKHAGIAFNAHFIADGAIVYRQACALGCEGIVSKRLGSPYRSGRTDCWVKVKNPAAPAVTREAEEEWH